MSPKDFQKSGKFHQRKNELNINNSLKMKEVRYLYQKYMRQIMLTKIHEILKYRRRCKESVQLQVVNFGPICEKQRRDYKKPWIARATRQARLSMNEIK